MNWNKPLEINVLDESAIPTYGWVDVIRVEDSKPDILNQTHKVYYLNKFGEAYWYFDDNGESRMAQADEEPFALVRNKLDKS